MKKEIRKFSKEFYSKKPDPRLDKFLDKHPIELTDLESVEDFSKKVKAYDRKKNRQGYNPGEDAKVYEAKEELSELSRKTLARYIKSASSNKSHQAHEIGRINQIASDGGANSQERKWRDEHNKKHGNRSGGIERAANKLAKESVEYLGELSKSTLARYIRKAADSQSRAAGTQSREETADPYDKDKKGLAKRVDSAKTQLKRYKGITNATNKLAKESVDEAAYSAKAAKEGKDLGKPGKNFSKIAKSAAKEYGSKEAGNRVAGAILAKIRAKHMKEDLNLKTVKNHQIDFEDPANDEVDKLKKDSASKKKSITKKVDKDLEEAATQKEKIDRLNAIVRRQKARNQKKLANQPEISNSIKEATSEKEDDPDDVSSMPKKGKKPVDGLSTYLQRWRKQVDESKGEVE